MGSNFCCLLETDSPIRSPKLEAGHKNCRWRETAMKYINPKSLLAAMKTRKTQLHQQEDLKQEMEVCRSKMLTLEDFIVSSPGYNRTNQTDCSGGEHLHLPKQSSRRIHPSFPGDSKEEALPSMEILMGTEAGNGQLLSSSFSRTRSEKRKKKVWFRSPEVADVFVLDSPVIYVSF
ncbi:hypothetical protein Salat_2031100 [Sesamum alatum]|uniref:Uncharacterized protein n=1 Tax=Sesamum alatum TaxID=300844 RepID=A0AAE1XZ76_9LAMI|nr:hypothetical protein Salat_2031100 [Sesamum alatum]